MRQMFATNRVCSLEFLQRLLNKTSSHSCLTQEFCRVIVSWKSCDLSTVLTFITFHISSSPNHLLRCRRDNAHWECQRTTGWTSGFVHPLEERALNEFTKKKLKNDTFTLSYFPFYSTFVAK